jgi:glutamyl-tRNA reductase
MMSINDILVVGANHKIATVEVRERLAFSPEQTLTTLRQIVAPPQETNDSNGSDEVQSEAIILSTCNRTEVYVCAGHSSSNAEKGLPPANASGAETMVRQFLSRYSQLPLEALDRTLYVYRGLEAAHHLLRVATGLDSLVIGENEILGQVKDAYEIAHAAGTTGPMLSALFRYAVQAGKRVHTETDIGQATLSMATIVVELAEEMFGSLVDRTALLLGAGKMSSMTARALVKAGLHCILVANRTYERAQKLAKNLGGRAVHFDALPQGLVEADIVICSTGAPHTVLHVADVQAATAARLERLLLVVDLAVPRDADPEIGHLPGVRLTDIDDLEALVQANHSLMMAVRQAAEAIVAEELADFKAWGEARLSVPLIRALRARADAICQAELRRTLPRLGDLTPQQQRAIEAMGQAIVNKLLHEPIVHLKNPPPGISRSDYADLAQSLFALN